MQSNLAYSVMDVEKYLSRIGIKEIPETNLEQLFYLQQQHLLHIPFENLNIPLGKKIILDYKTLYEKAVLKNRGGFCYEINGLFHYLLKEIGFKVRMISAKVQRDDGSYGPEFDHMANIVTLGDEQWLVDVAFGRFSFQPLKFELDTLQEDGRGLYKVTKYDTDYFAVETKRGDAAWKIGYLFSFDERVLSDFEDMCHYQQTSKDSNFTKRWIITIPTKKGRVTLTNTKLKIEESGSVEESEIDSKEMFCKALEKYFGMPFEYES